MVDEICRYGRRNYRCRWAKVDNLGCVRVERVEEVALVEKILSGSFEALEQGCLPSCP
jgi:hypothetical protein